MRTRLEPHGAGRPVLARAQAALQEPTPLLPRSKFPSDRATETEGKGAHGTESEREKAWVRKNACLWVPTR